MVLALSACSAHRGPVPVPPGTDAEIADAERLGRVILLHDTAAARASDELARIGGFSDGRVLGWITVPTSDGIDVRFVGKAGEGCAALYDVTFAADGTP